jgi:hypothetical protein
MKVKLVHFREVDIILSQLVLQRHVQQFHEQPLAVSVRSHGPLKRQVGFNGTFFSDLAPSGTGERKTNK